MPRRYMNGAIARYLDTAQSCRCEACYDGLLSRSRAFASLVAKQEEKEMSLTSIRRATATTKCFICEQHQSDMDYFQSLGEWVCDGCQNSKYYHDGNSTRIGRQNKLPSFSCEFEVGNEDALGDYARYIVDCEMDDDDDDDGDSYWDDDDAVSRIGQRRVDEFYCEALKLLKLDFSKHGDGTVYAEYKSPIYRDLQSARTAITTMNGLSHLVGEEAGTHIHVHFRHKSMASDHYSEIFKPLLDLMEREEDTTTALFGRYFNQWCHKTSYDRYQAINLQTSHQTMEFRLSKFVNDRQYLNLIRMVRKMAYVVDYLFDNRGLWTDGTPDYELMSQRLVSIYRKHAAIVEKECA